MEVGLLSFQENSTSRLVLPSSKLLVTYLIHFLSSVKLHKFYLKLNYYLDGLFTRI